MAERPTILVDLAPTRRRDEIFTPDDWARLNELGRVVWGRDAPMPPELFARERADAFAIVASHPRVGPIEEMPKLRAIVEVAGRLPSADQLDYPACFCRGVHVLSVAPAFAPMVAEMAVGMTLAAAREIVSGDADVRRGEERYLHAGNATTVSLLGAPIGFVGYGNLARAIRRLMAPFGGRVLAHDPWLPDALLRDEGVEPAPLATVMREARAVFVVAIVTQENAGLVSREMLELLHPDAVLALMSRAHVVDFGALTELLLAERFRAAIDVFPEEPVPADHPIRRARRAVLSAHRAGAVRSELTTLGRMVVDDLAAMIAGLPPRRLQRAERETVVRL